MPLTNAQYDSIMRSYNDATLKNRRKLDLHRAIAYREIPRLLAIEGEIAAVSVNTLRQRFRGKDPDFDLEAAIGRLSGERASLLAHAGLPADYLDMPYDCPICHDSGYVDNKKCSCFLQKEIELLYDQSNIREYLKDFGFEMCNLDYYSKDLISETSHKSAYDTAKETLEGCIGFVRDFECTFQNLLFYGETGVGKTFFSLCIAKELMDRQINVVYFTAADLFELFAACQFHAKENEGSLELKANLMNCDLLIVDDIGTEQTGAFTTMQLYRCIDKRILNKKSTIISTNLSLDQFHDRYSERTFSRILSNYTMIKLFGNDIRIQKKLSGGV